MVYNAYLTERLYDFKRHNEVGQVNILTLVAIVKPYAREALSVSSVEGYKDR